SKRLQLGARADTLKGWSREPFRHIPDHVAVFSRGANMAYPRNRLFVLCLGVLVVFGAALPAQIEEGTRIDGVEDFKGFDSSGAPKRVLFKALMYGEQKGADAKEMKEIASLAARWYVNRVTWRPIQSTPKLLELLHKDFYEEVIKPIEKGAKNPEFVALL